MRVFKTKTLRLFELIHWPYLMKWRRKAQIDGDAWLFTYGKKHREIHFSIYESKKYIIQLRLIER